MNFINLHKNKIIKGMILLFLIFMLLYPGASYRGASSGLLLWFHNVLPNLLPFIILSNLMVRLQITKQISRIFHPFLGRIFHISREGCYPILFGFLSGIPMGAKATADLVTEHKIIRKEGQFLLSMCNNASPMFIIGYIAITQLKLPHIKYALFVVIYGSAILSALFFRYFYDRLANVSVQTVDIRNKFVASQNPEELHTYRHDAAMRHHKQYLEEAWNEHPLCSFRGSSRVKTLFLHTSSGKFSNRFTFDLLDSSIMNGFEVVTRIGGYIILFSIMAQILKEIGPDTGMVKAFIMGILEITTGVSQVCNTNIDISVKIVLVAVLTSFGGFSGIAQTKSVLQGSRLSISSYIIVKLISAAITMLFSLLYVSFFLVI